MKYVPTLVFAGLGILLVAIGLPLAETASAHSGSAAITAFFCLFPGAGVFMTLSSIALLPSLAPPGRQ